MHQVAGQSGFARVQKDHVSAAVLYFSSRRKGTGLFLLYFASINSGVGPMDRHSEFAARAATCRSKRSLVGSSSVIVTTARGDFGCGWRLSELPDAGLPMETNF